MEVVQEAKVEYQSAEAVHMADFLGGEVGVDIVVGAGDASGVGVRRLRFSDLEGSHSESLGYSFLAAGHSPESTVVARSGP